MSDVIKLLPDSVANQIAAGEVIQRPASVVKELVENAVDAGATNISVIIKDAGRTLIQVVDNGCGMSATDARLAFERHSTSKITAANDLFTLHTMGFRGEALASICAVSQVELKTMRRDDTLGTRLVISGSRVEVQEPVATTPGSNMMVKNLFFNVPARRKFLKKDSVELNNIMREFERLALVNPGVDLSISHNDVTLHQLIHGSLKQRIGQLFGKSIEKQLIPIATETSLVKISGFVSLPECARKRGALQYLFVNGRNMRHPYFHKAVMHCYERLIRPDEQPNYFINFEVDPATIDVNIHPTKNEIKFENEQPIWQILVAAIRESLGKFNAVPAIDFDDVDNPEFPAFNSGVARSTDFTPDAYNPFAPENKPDAKPERRPQQAVWQERSRQAVGNWEQLYDTFRSATEQQPVAPDEFLSDDVPSSGNDSTATAQLDLNEEHRATPAVMQLKQKYILSQNKNGLLIIDQYRAHVRILFERFISREADVKSPSQKVMFPEILNLTPQQNIILHELLEELENAGFELELIGPNAWSINGIPSIELNDGPVELLKGVIEDVIRGEDVTREEIRRVLALNLARSGAIRGGRTLTTDEMEHLLSELFSLSTPAYTPDGQKIITSLTIHDIEKLLN